MAIIMAQATMPMNGLTIVKHQVSRTSQAPICKNEAIAFARKV